MEYYSVIERNTSESVLMRWMNLEPIVQSEGSQKEKDKYCIPTHMCFPYGSAGKEFACNAEDLGLTPGLGRSLGGGKGYPLQENIPSSSDSKSVCLQCGRPRFNTWVGKIHWRRKWQPIPVFLPGKSHGQRRLVGCSPWGHRESGTTDLLHFHFFNAYVQNLIKWY